ncbi:MAG: hypothetical protein M8353_09910 [ANME-2 cluster archaeon]|nr:hypothetical protein [ANME-2 cluster archaeon]MDW7776847.1 hypothetical protein [Methanosarcinales archaeon]
MSKTKESIRLIIGAFILLLIGIIYGIPLDEFYFMDKIIETTDDMPKASGEWGEIQEESTNSVKFLYNLLKITASLIGISSFILAGWYLYNKYI